MTNLISNEATKPLFTIAITEEGNYLAIRDESPMFALHGDTIVEAAQRAEEAFISYQRLSGTFKGTGRV